MSNYCLPFLVGNTLGRDHIYPAVGSVAQFISQGFITDQMLPMATILQTMAFFWRVRKWHVEFSASGSIALYHHNDFPSLVVRQFDTNCAFSGGGDIDINYFLVAPALGELQILKSIHASGGGMLDYDVSPLSVTRYLWTHGRPYLVPPVNQNELGGTSPIGDGGSASVYGRAYGHYDDDYDLSTSGENSENSGDISYLNGSIGTAYDSATKKFWFGLSGGAGGSVDGDDALPIPGDFTPAGVGASFGLFSGPFSPGAAFASPNSYLVRGSATISIDPVIAPSITIPSSYAQIQLICPLGGYGVPTSSSVSATCALTAIKFWPFKNRFGQPVFDENTGAQIHDMF